MSAGSGLRTEWGKQVRQGSAMVSVGRGRFGEKCKFKDLSLRDWVSETKSCKIGSKNTAHKSK